MQQVSFIIDLIRFAMAPSDCSRLNVSFIPHQPLAIDTDGPGASSQHGCFLDMTYQKLEPHNQPQVETNSHFGPYWGARRKATCNERRAGSEESPHNDGHLHHLLVCLARSVFGTDELSRLISHVTSSQVCAILPVLCRRRVSKAFSLTPLPPHVHCLCLGVARFSYDASAYPKVFDSMMAASSQSSFSSFCIFLSCSTRCQHEALVACDPSSPFGDSSLGTLCRGFGSDGHDSRWRCVSISISLQSEDLY